MVCGSRTNTKNIALHIQCILILFASFIGMLNPIEEVWNTIRGDVSHCLTIMSRLLGKPTICIGENKDAYQLRGNREADQRLCFRYSDSTIPPLPNAKISSF